MDNDIYKSDYFYDLPQDLIAKYPLKERTMSKLLCLDESDYRIVNFPDIVKKLDRNDLLVINETKVFQARLELNKKTGGRVEILIVEKINKFTANCLTRGLNKKLLKQRLFSAKFPLDIKIITSSDNKFTRIEFSQSIDKICSTIGSMPIPPYLKRQGEQIDEERYQSVFSNNKYNNSVAAPTASLHFDKELLIKLSEETTIAKISLDVGYGTFQPIKSNKIPIESTLHTENFYIPKNINKEIKKCRSNGGRVIALGTTTLRALESAYNVVKKEMNTGHQSTDIFIKDGYKFKVVDSLITNFHLPESSLLMLVCAFGDKSNVMNAYEYAIKNKLRFFSYGDAMLIEKCLSKF